MARSFVYTSPIIFSSAMVLALLEGRKTQTRRLITSQWQNVKLHFEAGEPSYLWVRESWGLYPKTAWHAPKIICPTDPDKAAYYKAGWERSKPAWKPSIHMPRWASRLSLKITDVRKQYLQDISYEDAAAEGLIKLPASGRFVVHRGSQYAGLAWHDPRKTFAYLWDSLHGHKEGESWADNPELYAFTFEVIQQNIDEVAA